MGGVATLTKGRGIVEGMALVLGQGSLRAALRRIAKRCSAVARTIARCNHQARAHRGLPAARHTCQRSNCLSKQGDKGARAGVDSSPTSPLIGPSLAMAVPYC